VRLRSLLEVDCIFPKLYSMGCISESGSRLVPVKQGKMGETQESLKFVETTAEEILKDDCHEKKKSSQDNMSALCPESRKTFSSC
jgi:hypothetical protein